MRTTPGGPTLLGALVLAAATLFEGARAAEPVEAFLTALRQRGYFEEATAYLDQLAARPELPAQVRERLLYEQGVTLLASAPRLTDSEQRESELARAAAAFEQFSKNHPDHVLATTAQIQLANLLVERGRAAMRAGDGSSSSGQSAEARRWFEQAREKFSAADKALSAQLQQLPRLIPPEEKELQARKRQLSGDQVEVQLLTASIDYDLAKTYEAGSADAKKHLKKAAELYAAFYENYRTRAAGLLARLWEGRCRQEMGEHRLALSCYTDLINLPVSDETRGLRAKAVRQALECWTDQRVKKYQEAIEQGERWQKEASNQESDADALAIRYLTALAYERQSQSLPAKDPNRKKFVSFAKQHVGAVARQPGEYQRSAKTMLVALGGAESKETAGAPKTFADAFEAAKEALATMQSASANVKIAQQGADQGAIAAAQKAKDEAAAQAEKLLQTCLALADSKTPAEDLNSVRYYLCFLSWDRGRILDAAVLGEFLADRYPDGLPGQQGARIALAAYVRMYSEAKPDDRAFETDRLTRIAELIFKRWAGQEQADEAALTLLNLAAGQGDLSKAQAYLEKIPADSPRRGAAEVRAGQSLWSAYLKAAQGAEENRPPQEQLDAMKTQAREVLSSGITRLEKADAVDAALIGAVFAMAQICVETGQPDKAIEWLEKPNVGALALIKAGNPVATRDAFATETYKLALRAYIAVTPQQLKKAEEMMDALEKQVQKSGDGKAADNLTAIYVSLGRQLQQQLQELRKSKQTKQLDEISKAFEVFLDRVSKRESGSNLASINWVGETYYSLGGGFDEGGSQPTARAKGYFLKAAAAYANMLRLAAEDPKYKDSPDALLSLRLRLADCQRRGGSYDEAIKTLLAVLKEKPMLLPAQVQAAETYQAKGATDAKAYGAAIGGASPDRKGKNTIWGWAQLSKMTMTNPDLAGTFHQARLNLAESRYRAALAEEDAARRGKILEAAKQDLWFTYKLHPELGGAETAARYDRLLKQIQKSAGGEQNGLAEFKQREAASADTKAK